MKKSDDSPHPCRSATPTVNSCDLTSPTRTQIFQQEYNDLTASKRQSSTLYSRSQYSQQLFTKNLVVCFLEVERTRVDVFGMLPRFFENLLESEILICSTTADENRTG